MEANTVARPRWRYTRLEVSTNLTREAETYLLAQELGISPALAAAALAEVWSGALRERRLDGYLPMELMRFCFFLTPEVQAKLAPALEKYRLLKREDAHSFRIVVPRRLARFAR